MNAIALAALAATVTAMLAALGATATDLQPSAHRVLVTAVVALIAPLFWPGRAKTPGRTALTIAGWSSAVTLLAAVALLVRGGAGQSLGRTATVCTVLLLIMLVTHAAAAELEGLVAAKSDDAEGAREMAGRAAAVALAILGSLPLWFGPAAELLAGPDAGLIDAVVGMSPLTHLAVASGNDLLRNQWFYQHSNLAALRYSYPGLTTLTATYVVIALTFVLVPPAIRRPGRPNAGITTHLTTERVK